MKEFKIKIDSLDKLYNAAQSRRSVFCPNCRCFVGPRPAAFVMNMCGSFLRSLFNQGMYVYTPQPSRFHKKPITKELPF